MNKRKINIIAGIVVVFLASLFYTITALIERHIDKDPVCVVGYVYHVESNRGGLNFKFLYNYQGVTHFTGVSSLGIEDKNNLVVVKISRTSPSLWRLSHQKPPDCLFRISNLFGKSWNTFPSCKNF